MNLVSIIIPYFKKKDYILDAINSILNQTYQNFEIIIVYDDIDKSELSLIYKIQKIDKRIKVLINKKNLGAGLSRNYAIKNSNGKYIAFLDADDIWNVEKLKKQVSIMEQKNLSITHTSYKILDKNNNYATIRIAKNLDYKKLLKSCDVGLSTVMIKKNLFSKKNKFSNLKTKEDYVLWLLLTKGGYIFYPIKEILTSWRISQNSLSSSVSRKLIDGFNVYYKYMKFSFIKSIFLLIQLSLNYLWKNLRF
ncbi:glycosyltransferase [Candidatus Pelagibacter bacterium]|nr:glycosyltransferase family 2 protein [Candidatus Pelagibacter bacterium]MDA8841277.1 glycosyltransferase [Candidatus Pelagibacter bacterium]